MSVAYKGEKAENKVSGYELDKILNKAEEKLKVLEEQVGGQVNREVKEHLYKTGRNMKSLPLELFVIYDKFDEKNPISEKRSSKRVRAFPFLARFAQWVKM
ncbi:hypothetical protein SAMN05421676_1046 [Salinibacillus kushneri]|uniref:Uncharacterized protein n=1 Tax=Salinibacillus kushneri TaxID=237682 RepID=A0A1I0DHT8_9BACI|nr:hypothetical protein [Salinibacillus kushneri]SET31324.1 hypothetical protein SAMN05421676_1046 [Salinibacillus kushneri]